jgi:hypothetical protein
MRKRDGKKDIRRIDGKFDVSEERKSPHQSMHMYNIGARKNARPNFPPGIDYFR